MKDPSFPSPDRNIITFMKATLDVWDERPDMPFNEEMKTARAMRDIRRGKSHPRHFNTRKHSLGKPATTLCHDFLGYIHNWHPVFFRPLNLVEWARLGGYPDNFRWPDKVVACQLIGNSVPPPLMERIAGHVKKEVLEMGVSERPTVISLFAGCGGSSLGYRQAGYRELLAVDFDRNSVETFRLNFPDIPCWCMDITRLDPREVMGFCGIMPGDLDVLDGSPPCQGFSTAGKRMVKDERNDLFLHFGRFLRGLRPKVFIAENVSGMAKGRMKGKFIEVMGMLRECGYTVKCKLMNAKYYGVPQSRERLIWIGTRSDIGGGPEYPKPSGEIVTMAKACPSIAVMEMDGHGYGYFPGARINAASRPSPTICRGGMAASYRVYGEILGGRRKHERISINRPSPTIKASGIGDSFSGNFHVRSSGDSGVVGRRLTIDEVKVLCGFPQDFRLVGNYRNQWARLGNAVPPKFMEVIARHIKETMFYKVPKTHGIGG
jgi:DNA (cytosine-5)-methyltransferase 1